MRSEQGGNHGNRRTALITGASRGIGKGIALVLAERGYDLVITHLDEQKEAEEVAGHIMKTNGVSCHVIQVDLSKADAPFALVEETVRVAGRIDVLVNNAGYCTFGRITEMDTEMLHYLIDLDFKAPLLMTKIVSKHMIEQGIRGNIIFITSSRAERAYPGDAVYGGTKAALKRACESIALDLAPCGIRVNCIAPGATKVREHREYYDQLGSMIPLGRMGTPRDIGEAVAWLCSDVASYVTGVSLRVDGGLILPGMPENPKITNGWGSPKS